jgi:methylated-DNA-[protein]-cysteine S-methyltransferase
MLVASEKRIPETNLVRKQAGILGNPCIPGTVERSIAVFPTAWGVCGAVWTCHETDPEDTSPFAARPSGARLCRLVLPGLTVGELRRDLIRGPGRTNEVIGDGHGNFHPEVVPDWFPELVRYLQGYYANTLRDRTQLHHVNNWTFWQPRLDWSPLTPFQRDVLQAVAEIPHGQRLTYGDIAKKVGKPRASRAVGAAVGSNPWPVLVPCHRVVGSGGRMTGFSAPGGVAAKKRMLAMEDPAVLFR